MLDALKNPNHEQHEETIEWIGEEFDPKFFDIETVNKLLKKQLKYSK